MEQCNTVKFSVRFKKSIVETIALLKKIFRNVTLHDLTIRKWHTEFTDGRESAEIKYVGGGLGTVMTDVNINTVSVDFFLLIDHRLNRSLKIDFFRFLEILIMFERSGND